jgi:isopenicillin-N epimerase
VISLVTSPTGLVFPIEDIVRGLAQRGIDTLVDGAHAPGMLPLALDQLGAAYFTGNAHKWLCTPKGSAVLHVRRDRQQQMRPLVISHGSNSPRRDRSRFRLEFDWGGTGDPSPYLVIPTALEFLEGLMSGGWPELQAHNRDLAVAARRLLLAALGDPPPLAPESMLGSLAAVELPRLEKEPTTDGDSTYPLDPLHDTLWGDHRIEVPVYTWPHSPADAQSPRRLARVSAQAYNSIEDYERLASVLPSLI